MSVDWRLIGNLYMGQKIIVKIEGEFSEPDSIGQLGKTRVPTLAYTVQHIY